MKQRLRQLVHNLRIGSVDYLKYSIGRFKLMLTPARCVDCSTRVAPTLSPEYRISHTDPAYSWVRAAVTICSGGPICRSCLARRVSALFRSLARQEDRKVMLNTEYSLNRCCDSCRRFRPTIRIGTNEGPAPCDIRISVAWWNGFHVCEDCIVTAVKYGALHSGVISTRRTITGKLERYVVCTDRTHRNVYLRQTDKLLQPLKD
jgi:hypothetical protein